MKKNEKTSMSKRRATVAAVLCFVAAIAIAGTYTFNDYRKTQKNELAKAEEKSRQEETKKDNKDNSDLTRETGTSKVKVRIPEAVRRKAQQLRVPIMKKRIRRNRNDRSAGTEYNGNPGNSRKES